MAPPQSSNLMSGWPKHMYVGGDENGAIRCLARDCGHTFTTNESMRYRVAHYIEGELNSTSSHLQVVNYMERDPVPTDGDIYKNDHGLLKQMHTLKICLACHRVLLDSRDLFNHIVEEHPEEMEISHVPGFLLHVRRFASQFPNGTAHELQYRDTTFKLAFDHLLLQLKRSDNWNTTKALVLNHWYDRVPSYEFLREFFTKPAEDTQYLPYHPDEFLSATHHPNLVVRPDDLHALRGILRALQDLYRNGRI